MLHADDDDDMQRIADAEAPDSAMTKTKMERVKELRAAMKQRAQQSDQ